MPITRARLRISDYNEKRKAELKTRERRLRIVNLSLTSMVDMFAILVIFLLSNSATVNHWIEVSQGLDLPKSKSGDPIAKGISLQVSRDMIYADTKPLLEIKKLQSDPNSIAIVKDWLEKQPKEKDTRLNILGHESLPFGVMRKVIASTQQAGFASVNFGVEPKP